MSDSGTHSRDAAPGARRGLRLWRPGADPEADVRHYEAFTRWAYGLGIVVLAGFAVSPALAGPAWFAILTLSLLVAMTVAGIRLADLEFRELHPSRSRRLTVLTLGLGLMACFIMGSDPTSAGTEPGKLNGVEGDVGFGAIPVGAALLAALGASWSMRRLTALLAGQVLLIGGGQFLQGLRAGKAAQIALIALVTAGIIVPIGYLSRRTLEVVRSLHRTRETFARLAVTRTQARFHQDVTSRYERELRAIAADCRAARTSGPGAGPAELMTRVATRADECDQGVRALSARYREVSTLHPGGVVPAEVTSEASGSVAIVAEPGPVHSGLLREASGRRARVTAARAAAGGDLPAFERYVVISVLLLYLPGVVSWLDKSAAAGGAARTAAVVLGVLFFGAAARVVAEDLGGSGVHDRVRLLVAVTGVALTGLGLGTITGQLATVTRPLVLDPAGMLPLTLLAVAIRWVWRRCLLVLVTGVTVVAGMQAAAGVSSQEIVTTTLLVGALSTVSLLLPRVSWWMLEIAWALHRDRATRAALAVSDEQLRFARDLHDGYGRALAAVAMKGRLGAELARRNDRTAATEIAAVERLVTDALAAVPGVVAGGQNPDLPTEVAAAEALLRSVGAQVRLDGFADTLPRLDEESSRALAWVVREGATNVWRHSQPSAVSIELKEGSSHLPGRRPHATLTIRNDGLIVGAAQLTQDALTPGPAGGSGLTGLAERLAPVHGTMTAGANGGDFVLEATVPLRASPDRRRRDSRADRQAEKVGL